MTIRHDFPDFDVQAVASQGNAILGIRDSGKSYTAIKIAEMFYDAGVPWVAFDPSGRWRFIRVPGHGNGYPVVVAGGMAADLPLTVETAPQIVRAAMESGVSLVIDLYDINISKADWKHIVGSCVRVLLYENSAHGLRHIFIEEAAEFCPQRVGPDQGVVYAEMEKLARMGGNARLGYTLINQRSEEVSKAVLELCDNLFLHRQKGRNSLNALTKWLDLGDVKPGSREIIKSLPMLPQGECWAWMGGTNRPVHMKVPQKNSFEPDRRAMRGEVVASIRPAVDVGTFVSDLRARLSGKKVETKVVAPVKQSPKEDKDVKESEAKALRAENERLRSRLAALESAPRANGKPQDAPVAPMDVGAIIDEIKRRARTEPELIELFSKKPRIEVTVTRPVISVDDSTLAGRCAGLIAEGFFDEVHTASAAYSELQRRGFSTAKPNVYKACDQLTTQGFLTKEKDGYQSVKDMKVKIIEA